MASPTLDTSDRQLRIAGYEEAVERRCFAPLADDSSDDLGSSGGCNT